MNSPEVNRWFWKCFDCLSVVAVSQDIKVEISPDGKRYIRPECGLCGGDTWCMGRVERDRLTRTDTRCACDHRCTSATGPTCVCKCGGENHGTHRVVEVVTDLGKAPKLCTPNCIKSRHIAEEYRAELAPLIAERDRLCRLKSEGWIDRGTFDRMRAMIDAVAYAKELKTHAGRMKHIRSIADRWMLSPA